jgi:opacity protein-like surface antigen
MKKTIGIALLAVALFAGVAGAANVGIGAYGGVGIPILQDDNGRATTFGIRAPVSLIPLLTVEPYFTSSSGSDKDQDVGGTTITRTGIDVTGFGANAMLTMGGPVSFYPFAGIGSHKLKRDGADETRTTFAFGMGVGVSPMPKLTIHIRGQLDAAVKDEASRKWGTVTVGASYNILSFPPVP